MKRRVVIMIMILLLVCVGANVYQQKKVSAASQKHVIIWSLKGKKLQYYKAYSSFEYLNQDAWGNTIGGGKRKSS